MIHAAITGWGKCMPPAVLTNADVSTFLDTTDEWIVSRTGMRERRISHVPAITMATVAAKRALACAGLDAAAVDLIVYGSCSNDEQVPNSASGVQLGLGATRAAAMDINTACTSFLYGLSAASAMIATGGVRTAIVIGVEVITPYVDWDNRNVAVLFGDGCAAVVLQGTDRVEGLLGAHLGCYADARHTLRVRGMGCAYANRGVLYGDTQWDFDGPEIFRHAVQGMTQASTAALAACGIEPGQIDLVVPHQANRRIIDAVVSRTGIPEDRVMLTVQRYGNMSSATVPVALVDALEEGRVQPGALLLMPAFGAGLTLCAHVVRWGARVTPIGSSDAELPACTATALELVSSIRARKVGAHERSGSGLNAAPLVDQGRA
jgi:3-oxoacyl-[acyl-carrier-protein] synthase III